MTGLDTEGPPITYVEVEGVGQTSVIFSFEQLQVLHAFGFPLVNK